MDIWIPLSLTSDTIFLISSFLGSKPKALIATFKSLESITPWLAVSNRLQQGDIGCHCTCHHRARSPESLFDVWLLLLSEIKFGRHSFPLCTSRHVWKQFNHDGWRYMEGELTYRPCITGCLFLTGTPSVKIYLLADTQNFYGGPS